jgi:hypothetical protein
MKRSKVRTKGWRVFYRDSIDDENGWIVWVAHEFYDLKRKEAVEPSLDDALRYGKFHGKIVIGWEMSNDIYDEDVEEECGETKHQRDMLREAKRTAYIIARALNRELRNG